MKTKNLRFNFQSFGNPINNYDMTKFYANRLPVVDNSIILLQQRKLPK